MKCCRRVHDSVHLRGPHRIVNRNGISTIFTRRIFKPFINFLGASKSHVLLACSSVSALRTFRRLEKLFWYAISIWYCFQGSFLREKYLCRRCVCFVTCSRQCDAFNLFYRTLFIREHFGIRRCLFGAEFLHEIFHLPCDEWTTWHTECGWI